MGQPTISDMAHADGRGSHVHRSTAKFKFGKVTPHTTECADAYGRRVTSPHAGCPSVGVWMVLWMMLAATVSTKNVLLVKRSTKVSTCK